MEHQELNSKLTACKQKFGDVQQTVEGLKVSTVQFQSGLCEADP